METCESAEKESNLHPNALTNVLNSTMTHLIISALPFAVFLTRSFLLVKSLDLALQSSGDGPRYCGGNGNAECRDADVNGR